MCDSSSCPRRCASHPVCDPLYRYLQVCEVKGLVHPKVTFLSLVTHPHFVTNLNQFLSHVEHKRRSFEEYWYSNSWWSTLTSIVFLGIFFKISSFVFNIRQKLIPVWSTRGWENGDSFNLHTLLVKRLIFYFIFVYCEHWLLWAQSCSIFQVTYYARCNHGVYLQMYNYLVCFNSKLYSAFVKLFQNITCFPFHEEK